MASLHPMQEAYLSTLREQSPQLIPARVIFTSHESYTVLIPSLKKERTAKLRGHFYHEGEELPVVGDWVAVELTEGDHEFLRIEATLPRTTSLRRFDASRGHQTLVANVDYVCLVTSFNEDFNERRLERGLAMINEGKATPIIILNKGDLIDKEAADKYLQDLTSRFPHVKVMTSAAKKGVGVEEIRSLFKPNQSITFLGMSGVGKSTLINALLGSNELDTGGIREDDARGRHTTTHREMFLTKDGYWVIDNPGIREFSFHGDDSTLETTFDDVADLVSRCRFGNCSHEVEPGCKVKEALASGELSKERWGNYSKMKKEIAYQAAKFAKRNQKKK